MALYSLITLFYKAFKNKNESTEHTETQLGPPQL